MIYFMCLTNCKTIWNLQAHMHVRMRAHRHRCSHINHPYKRSHCTIGNSHHASHQEPNHLPHGNISTCTTVPQYVDINHAKLNTTNLFKTESKMTPYVVAMYSGAGPSNSSAYPLCSSRILAWKLSATNCQ